MGWHLLRALSLILAFSWGLLAPAHAGDDVTRYGPTVIARDGGFDFAYSGSTSSASGRTYSNGSDGSVSVVDSLSVSTAVGPLAVSISRTIPWHAVVNGAVAGARACLGNPACIGSAAVIAGIAAYRCELVAWSWMCDPGFPPIDSSEYVYCVLDNGLTDMCASTASQAVSIKVSDMNSNATDCWVNSQVGYGKITYSIGAATTYGGIPAYSTNYVCTAPGGSSSGSGPFIKYGTKVSTIKKCPIVNGVEGKMGPDGLCPTGASVSKSDSEVSSLLPVGGIDMPTFQGAVPGIVYSGNGTFSVVDPFVITPAWRYATGKSTTTTSTDAQGNVKTETATPSTTITNNTTNTGINVTNNTTTITQVNGQTTGTTTETKPQPSPTETVSPPGNPAFGEIPKLYTPVFTNGLAGVWQSRQAQLQQTPIMQFLSSLVPNLGSGGCPTWSFSPGSVLGIGVQGDISVPCYVWSAIRLIMVLSALMLCRRLIFGG